MAGAPPPPLPPNSRDLKLQRRMMRDQARAQQRQYRYQMRGLRRRSIIGPILVILLGVFILLVEAGRLPFHDAWIWYARWWPLILIVVGIVHLAEWGIDQARPRDPQQLYIRRTLGGGVITLLILLALTGVFFNRVREGHTFFAHGFSINPDSFDEFLGSKHESDESRVETLSSDSIVTIDNPRGDVTVTGTSSDNQLHIAVHKQIYSRSDSEAESKAGELTPQISGAGKQLIVTLPNLRGASADITVSVPSSVSITVSANHGDVHVDSIHAPVTVTANHGDVELSGIAGTVIGRINNSSSSFSAHDIIGSLSVEGRGQDLTLSDIHGAVTLSGDFYGTTHLEHIANAIKFHTSRTTVELARLDGDLDISSDADLSLDQALGPVLLTTRNRNIDLQRISGNLSVTNRNGSVELSSAPPLGNVTVQNRNGSVTLTLPNQANFAVNASTNDGDIENDFSLPAQKNDSRNTLNGTVGKGGAVIHINTTQGDVSLRKATIAPLPPAPPSPPHLLDLEDENGSSVTIGKDGVRVINQPDGSSVVIGKKGLRIATRADGSSIYRSSDGALLTQNVDGAKALISRDETRYTINVDGSRLYKGADGTSIVIDTDGSRTATGPHGTALSDMEVRQRLNQADAAMRRAEQQRKAEQRSDSEDR